MDDNLHLLTECWERSEAADRFLVVCNRLHQDIHDWICCRQRTQCWLLCVSFRACYAALTLEGRIMHCSPSVHLSRKREVSKSSKLVNRISVTNVTGNSILSQKVRSRSRDLTLSRHETRCAITNERMVVRSSIWWKYWPLNATYSYRRLAWFCAIILKL